MQRTLLGSLLASLLVFGCGSSAEPTPPTAHTSQQIAGGEPDSTDANVIGMFSMATGGMCSGTLIAPNLVLTARHCVSKLSPDNNGAVMCGTSIFLSPQSGGSLMVSTDAQLSQQGTWYPGSEVLVPSESNSACGFDVALVILAENVPTPPRVPRIDLEPQTGEPYTAVGYGQQGSSGWTAGERMMLGGLQVMCGSGECSGGIESTEFLGDTGVCQGDSGGPALDANGKVIGVVSRGGQGCTTPIYGAVAVWRDWIIAVAKDAAQKGGYAPPFWALSGKSDPEEPPPAGTGGAGGTSGTNPSGQTCSPTQPCPGGFQCFANGDPNQGQCFQLCDASNPCGAGQSCNGQGVCETDAPQPGKPESSNQSSGCSIQRGGSERGPAKPVPWLVGALGLLAGLRRRRR